MATMDIFNNDAFGLVEMTDAVEKLDYQPRFLGQLGIFQPRPVRTVSVAVEKKAGVLALVPTSARGAPPTPRRERAGERADIRDFRAVRIAEQDTITADELSGIRAFGTESELVQVMDEVADRYLKLERDIETTLEHMRLGAVQGIVYDSDGATELFNWFDSWGIAQPAEVDFDLDNATPASGAVRILCNQIIRSMARASKGAWVEGQSYVMGLCGDTFFDQLTAHSEVRSTYLNQAEASELRNDFGAPFGQVRYGGITWVNYRGTDDGSTVAVPATKVKFFPVRAPGVFEHVMAPGETMSTVNQPGRLFMPLIVPDDKRQMFVDLELYSYPLMLCTRPEMLLRGKNT